MKLLSVREYAEFECIGGECPITCCGGGWNIGIDDETAEYYRTVEGEFGDELRNGMCEEDGVTFFKLRDNKDCYFLDESRLCRIIRNLGEEKLCYTCKCYPRDFFEVGDIMFCCFYNSCPEVNKLIFQRKEKMDILFDDSDGIAESVVGVNWSKFNNAIKAFSIGMDIIQNRDISVSERLYLITFFTLRFQELMKENKDTTDLTGVFSKPEIYIALLESKPIKDVDYISKISAFKTVFSSLLADSCEHPMWKNCKELAENISTYGVSDPEVLRLAFIKVQSDKLQTELERLMTFRFLATFMRGFDSCDYYERLVNEYVLYAALITYTALVSIEYKRECTQEERILFYSLCSRIEHNKRRKTELKVAIKESGFYELEMALKLIS